MKLMRRLTRASLKRNPVRTMVTILGIALSTALITAVLTLFSCGQEAFINYKSASDGSWHMAVFEADAKQIQTMEGAEEVRELSKVKDLGFARVEEIQNPDKPYVRVRALDANAAEALAFHLTEGKLPENAGEIVIPTHLSTNGGLHDWKIGDTVTLDLGQRSIDGKAQPLYLNEAYSLTEKEELLPLETRTYKIVGRMERPSFLVEDYASAGYTCITAPGPEDAGGIYTVYLRLKQSALAHVDETAEKLMGESPDTFGEFGYACTFNFNLIDLEESFLSNDNIMTMAAAGLVALLIIIAASVICIRNSFTISINEKVQQYGMLCSIGATKKQVRRNVLYEALLLGLIGIPLGILIGIAGSYVMVHVSNHYIGQMGAELGILLRFQAEPFWILAGALLSALTVFLSALAGVRIASKVSPMNAIRTGGEQRERKQKMGHIHFRNVCANLAARNRRYSRRKYRTTLLSIASCVALFVAMSSFVQMFYHQIQSERETVKYDLEIGVRSEEEEDFTELISVMSSFDGIRRFTFRKDAMAALQDAHVTEEYQALSLDPSAPNELLVAGVSEEELRRLAGEIGCHDAALHQKGILINTDTVYSEDGKPKTVKKYGCQAGDAVVLMTETLGAEHAEVPIAAVTDWRSFSFSDTMLPVLVVGDTEFTRLFGTTQDSIQFYYETDVSERIQKEAEEFLHSDAAGKVLKGKDALGLVTRNVSEEHRHMSALLTLVSIFLYGFILVVAFIGVTNIINTVITNTELRKNEYAMLCSVGMSGRQLVRMIGLEHLMVGGIALLAGLPIGVLLAWILGKLLDVYEFLIPWKGMLISVAAVAVLLLLLTRLSWQRFRRQSMIEMIRARAI